MTREPFIAHSELTNEIYIVQGQNKYRVTEQVIHAVKAIKALEQESILDKIRAEIEAKCCITVGRENDGAITLYDVFEILDKYRTESEG